MKWASPSPSSALAGPTSSSSTAKSTRSAPVTASPPKQRSPKFSRCSHAAAVLPSSQVDQPLFPVSCFPCSLFSVLVSCKHAPRRSQVPLASPLAFMARCGPDPALCFFLFSPPPRRRHVRLSTDGPQSLSLRHLRHRNRRRPRTLDLPPPRLPHLSCDIRVSFRALLAEYLVHRRLSLSDCC